MVGVMNPELPTTGSSTTAAISPLFSAKIWQEGGRARKREGRRNKEQQKGGVGIPLLSSAKMWLKEGDEAHEEHKEPRPGLDLPAFFLLCTNRRCPSHVSVFGCTRGIPLAVTRIHKQYKYSTAQERAWLLCWRRRSSD